MISEQTFFDYFKQQSENFPAMAPHITNGESELISLVGEEQFDSVEALEDQTVLEKRDKRKLQLFQNALCELTMASVLPVLNLVVGDLGLIQSNTAQEFGGSQYKIATPAQVEEMQRQHIKKAESLIDTYIINPGGLLAVVSGE